MSVAKQSARTAPDPILIPGIAADGALYPIEKLAAHRKGALHQAVSVFLFDGDLLLIQKRAADKYHCGGLWANSCCSHPHWGESLEACAKRRVREELGFDPPPLAPRGAFEYRAAVGNGLWEHERVRLFRAEVDRARLEAAPDPAEVEAIDWRSVADLRAEAGDERAPLAPWFRIYLASWDALGLTP